MDDIDPRRRAFGAQLRALRARSGQTQVQAAAAVGIYPTHFSEIERGNSNVTLDNILKLADHFRVTPASLLEPEP